MNRWLRFIVSIVFATYAAGAAAQSSQRAGKWEFSLLPQFTHSINFDTANGSSGHVDSSLGFGFGVAYNLNNNLELGSEFVWSNGSYSATIAPAAGNGGPAQTLVGTLETSTIRFTATWNFIATGDFTPFATVGIGSTYIDTNIPYANTPATCWWDPWWGYYCSQPTRSAYDVSYNAALGLRWEIDRSIFVRGLVNRTWIDVGGSLGTPWVDQYRIDVGFKF